MLFPLINKKPPGRGLSVYWRRERDSNPRWAFNPYSLSRGAPSATRPSLRSLQILTQASIVSNFCSGLLGAIAAPRPFGAAVASRRPCLAPAALGSNPRWAFNPYSLSRGARYSGHPALRPVGQPRSAPLFQIAPGDLVSHSAFSPVRLDTSAVQPEGHASSVRGVAYRCGYIR